MPGTHSKYFVSVLSPVIFKTELIDRIGILHFIFSRFLIVAAETSAYTLCIHTRKQDQTLGA